MNGILYIIATPIGNLKDITLRALEVLKEVDLIVAEDTRHTLKLLQQYQIRKELFSYYEQVEQAKLPILMGYLKEGKRIALVTDAGTPTVSDPGFRWVREAAREGFQIISIPGPSAAIAALSVSGLPTDRFEFLGFLPEKPGKRKQALAGLSKAGHTLIFYLSKWKFQKNLEEMIEVFGDRPCFMARELTKLHEECWRGSLSNLLLEWKGREPKGEITLIVGGRE